MLKKYINHVTHPLRSAEISIFSTAISKFSYIKKYRYRLHFDTWLLTLLTFFEPFLIKIFLITMLRILMMSAKMATLGLLKIKVFWKKHNDVIISVYDITNKTLSRDSSYFVNLVMWPRFGNSSTSMREVISTSILWGFDQKNTLFFAG